MMAAFPGRLGLDGADFEEDFLDAFASFFLFFCIVKPNLVAPGAELAHRPLKCGQFKVLDFPAT